MTSIVKTALLAAVGAAAVACAAPAFAASAATDAFVANVRPNVDFLDNSSRLALKSSTSAKVRTFARTEATDQTLAGNQLVAWTQTQTAPGIAATTGAPVVAPLIGEPVAVATAVPVDVANGVGDVLTGRSVAIDTPAVEAPLTVTRTPAPGTLLPSQEIDMDRLSKMSGKRFDAFYVTTQKDALHQLATLYTDYAANGDDPALRAMAARQLPIVRQRLEQLRGM